MQIEGGQRAQRHAGRTTPRHRALHRAHRRPQPTPLRRRAGGASRFGGVIVQGGGASGLLNDVGSEDLPGPGSVFLHVDWSFRAPVRPGDSITAEVEVIEVRPDKPISKLRTSITNQDGTVVLDGEALVWTEQL